ncbi:hypothetical protein E2I00_006889 [Balaenoptera physalus]|uniref:Uncharacterized protein n=1 Tax=Balaenoptera physalus TaxID=9770 RepID=A0A643CBN9_BALPH|nr:hypothetical protein E2I00_006889 [Balaenoptera physalus]
MMQHVFLLEKTRTTSMLSVLEKSIIILLPKDHCQLPQMTFGKWFWKITNVIVMITREVEGGVIKCHHYWPVSMKKPLELKNCHIFLENYQILQYFVIRIFQVVKKSVKGFIKYVRYVRKSHLTGTIIVHCSAGAGRTGVFLCVDVVFCAIEKNFSVSV